MSVSSFDTVVSKDVRLGEPGWRIYKKTELLFTLF